MTDEATRIAHARQIHPAYLYCVTFDGTQHNVDVSSWEPNHALADGYRGCAGAEQYRPEHEPRERYWMRRIQDPALDEPEQVARALHRARSHPEFVYRFDAVLGDYRATPNER